VKSLFDDKEDWNTESNALDRELMNAMGPIAEKWAKLGYSKRQIQLILITAAHEVGVNIVIDWANIMKDVPQHVTHDVWEPKLKSEAAEYGVDGKDALE
jgi:hypothetical protein